MNLIDTGIKDLVLLEPKKFGDSRGYFMETYNERSYSEAGITAEFVQDNESYSRRGVLRGLHYQTGDDAQAKLVRVVQGEVLDVAVDIRQGSPTFGKVYAVVLTADNARQLFIPRGFAHGFAVLSETALFSYKCDNFYAPQSEGGIIYNDPELSIDWQLNQDEMIVSDKDLQLPTLENAQIDFQYA